MSRRVRTERDREYDRKRRGRRYSVTCPECERVQWIAGGNKPVTRVCVKCAKPRYSKVPWRPCCWCGATFVASNHKRRCPTCHALPVWTKENKRRSALLRGKSWTCECGTKVDKPLAKCEQCRAETRRSRKRRERVRRKNRLIIIEAYTLSDIAQRDSYRCGICKLRVNMNLAVPHPQAATIDHIIAVAHGGQDTRANVQLAHFKCNYEKRDLITTEQLRLVG